MTTFQRESQIYAGLARYIHPATLYIMGAKIASFILRVDLPND
jgi:hypothetical protein